MAMSTVTFFSNFHVDFNKASCRMSYLRNDLCHVADIFSRVDMLNRMSILRRDHVALSNLRVKGHRCDTRGEANI